MQLLMPDNVRFIIKKLQDEGFEAYAVGGCVRDSYLGLTPHDWDITTNALPLQVKSLFRRTIDVGIQHGTVKIMLGDEGYEVTTYRIDGEYEDNRHPKEVIFTASLEEDLKRRDFTINAMAYSESTGIIDLFNGIQDIENGVIRAVGEPSERFSEDALRILRALRFSARFDYEIDGITKDAITELAPTLAKISAERIREELEKLLISEHPNRLRMAYELGVTKVILPEWDKMMQCEQNTKHHYLSVGEHTLRAIELVTSEFGNLSSEERRIVCIAALFHDVAKPIMKTTDANGVDHFKGHPEEGSILVKDILRRLKYDNDTIGRVSTLIKYHDLRPSLTFPNVRKLIVKVGVGNMPCYMVLRWVDMWAQSEYEREEKSSYLKEMERIYKKILSDGDCLSIKDLAVTGKDLIAAGVKSGPGLGEMLEEMLELVMQDPLLNEHDILMERFVKV